MLSIVIPTYNEKENICQLLDRLQSILQGLDHEIIVVDDESPDGTGEAVQLIASKNKNIRLIERKEKRGLSSAVMEGFQQARGTFLGVMDADGSHDPKVIPQMVQLLQAGEVDCVVGSRKIKGGSVGQWPWYRHFSNWVATGLVKILIDCPVQDPMSGFFCISRQTYQNIPAELRPSGYKILLELLSSGGFKKVIEIPYTFTNRRQGRSKVSLIVFLAFIYQLFRLFCNRLGWRLKK